MQPLQACGLDYLRHLDSLLVKQKTSMLEVISQFVFEWEVRNKYDIYNANGQMSFFALEDSEELMRQCCGKKRSFVMHVVDTMGQDVLLIHRPFKCFGGVGLCVLSECCADEVTVTLPNGEELGRIVAAWACIKPHYYFYDPSGQLQFEMWGPLCTCSCMSDAQFEIFRPGETG